MNTTDGLKLLLMATVFAALVVWFFGSIFYALWVKLWLGEWGPADVMRWRGVFPRLIIALLCLAVLYLFVWVPGWTSSDGFYARWSLVFPSLRSDLAFIGPLWLGLVLGFLIGVYAGQLLAFRLFKKFRRVRLLKLKTEV